MTYTNKTNLKDKSNEKRLHLKQSRLITSAVCPIQRGKYYSDALEFCTHSFLLVSFLEQTSEDGIGNTEHSNINVTAEGNGR